MSGVKLTCLHAVAGVAIIACAVAVGFAPWVPGWWRLLAIGGAAAGIAGFTVFWDGHAGSGRSHRALISLVMLGTAIAFPQAFGG